MKFFRNICLAVALVFSPVYLHTIGMSSYLYSQDFDDDDEFADEEETEIEEIEEIEERKNEYDDEFADEDEIDKTVEKEEDEIDKKQKEKERAAKEQKRKENEKRLAEEEKKRKRDRLNREKDKKKRDKEAALAETRMREARKKAEEKRAKHAVERSEKRKKQLSYSHYFTTLMANKNIKSRMKGLTGWAFSFTLGLQPNVGNAVNEGFTFSNELSLYLIGGASSTSAVTLPLSTSGIQSNKGVADIANMFQNNVSEFNQNLPKDGSVPEATVDSSSGSIHTLPIGVSAAYYAEFFLIRLGVNFHHSLIGIGGTNKFSFSFAGQPVFIEHTTTVIRLEVPLSLAVRFLSTRAYGMYMGGGLNFFWGQNISEISSNERIDFVAENGQVIPGAFEGEIDKFSASTLGFHFLIGIEAEIWNRVYLTVELFQNFGFSDRVKDSEIGARNNSTVGTPETQRPDEIQLNFSGTEILLVIRKFI